MMKLAFSTLGCPDFDWSDIYSMAKDLGFHGIEIRGIGEETNVVKTRPFSAEKVDKTIEKLRSLKLEIPCLSTGCCLKFADKREENIAEITAHADLAAKLNTPYIRILADLTPAPEGEVDDSFIAEVLKEVAAIAESRNVTLLVETNGVYSDSERLRRLLDYGNLRSRSWLPRPCGSPHYRSHTSCGPHRRRYAHRCGCACV